VRDRVATGQKQDIEGHGSHASSIRANHQEPGVASVALDPSVGPVPPPTTVVMPVESATSKDAGSTK